MMPQTHNTDDDGEMIMKILGYQFLNHLGHVGRAESYGKMTSSPIQALITYFDIGDGIDPESLKENVG